MINATFERGIIRKASGVNTCVMLSLTHTYTLQGGNQHNSNLYLLELTDLESISLL